MKNTNNVQVSVIMPAYNAEAFLAESIESALNQTFNALEVVVVDDGSSDRTVEIAESYGDRVRVFCQKNGGAAAARNNAVSRARGEWIAFLDADDLWLPDKIEKQMVACSGNVWSHTNSVFVGAGHDGTIKSSDRAPQFGGNVVTELVVNNFIGTSTVMVRRDVFETFGGFDESLRAIQDWDLWLKISAKYEITYLPAVLARYRVHAASTSRSARKTLPNHLKVIERAFAEGGAGEGCPELRTHALASSYGVCSLVAEESNDPVFALKCAIRAGFYQPVSIWRWKCVLRIILLELPKAAKRRWALR